MQALLKDIRKTSALTDPDVANHQGARKTEYIRVVAVRGGTVADKQTRQGCIKVVGTLQKRYIWTLLDELSRSVRRMTRNSNIRFLTPPKFGSTPFPRV